MTDLPQSPPLAGFSSSDWAQTPEGKLYAELSAAPSHRQVALVLRKLGLDISAIARGAAVQPSSVSRWLSNAEVDVRRPGRLGELRAVVLALLKSRQMTLGMLPYWLTSGPDVLLGQEPLLAIADGRYEDVVEAGRSLTDPAGPATREEFELRRSESRRFRRGQAVRA